MATAINRWSCTVASEDLLLTRFISENPHSHTHCVDWQHEVDLHQVVQCSKTFPENVIVQDYAQEDSHRISFPVVCKNFVIHEVGFHITCGYVVSQEWLYQQFLPIRYQLLAVVRPCRKIQDVKPVQYTAC